MPMDPTGITPNPPATATSFQTASSIPFPEPTPARPPSRVESHAGRDTIQADIPSDKETDEATLYKNYYDHAKKEDAQLIKKYSEDISGLLTFAGLLSAIITAFLLVEQTDFKVHSTATTNILLYHIYLKLDKSEEASNGALGAIPPDLFNVNASQLDTNVVALYYTSLSFSLISAFGGLVSKQWIMHYENLPPWADTTVRKAHLRRMRHQGLRSWGFYTLMTVIPRLIQLSLLLFAVGVFLSSRPGGVVWYIMVVSISVGAFFWTTTVILGTLFPSSPFKSPTSDALFKVIFFVGNLQLYLYRSIGNWLPSKLAYRYRNRMLWVHRELLEGWDSFQKHWGEEWCLDEESISAGIRWWGMRQRLTRQDAPILTDSYRRLAGLQLVKQDSMNRTDRDHAILVQQHARTVQKMVGNDRLLLNWGWAVLRSIESQPSLNLNELKAQVEVLCDLINNVPAAGPFLQDVALSRAIRHSHGVVDDQPLKISTMSRTTAATYFRALLCAGISTSGKPLNELTALMATLVPYVRLLHAGSKEDITNPTPTSPHFSPHLSHDSWIYQKLRRPLCEEICEFLHAYRFNPSQSTQTRRDISLEQSAEDITTAVALASVAIAGDDGGEGHRSVQPFDRVNLTQCKPYRQLSHAWQRLSRVDFSKLAKHELYEPLCDLMISSLSASATLLHDPKTQRGFSKLADAGGEHFCRCLNRLSKLPKIKEDGTPYGFMENFARLAQDIQDHKANFPPKLLERLFPNLPRPGTGSTIRSIAARARNRSGSVASDQKDIVLAILPTNPVLDSVVVDQGMEMTMRMPEPRTT